MYDERYIHQCVKDLITEYGSKAEEVAEQKMRDLLEKNDVKEAGLWLAVLHEIHRSNSQQVH